jgi:hypothetical protein
MTNYNRNNNFENEMLPVDIVLHPSWWNKHEGITFDPDFFYHPAKRVEAERKMEKALYERWGQYGLGENRNEDRPELGAVHLAAGFLLSEMLGCEVEYRDNTAPTVHAANREDLKINPEDAFKSKPFKQLEGLMESLKERYGYLCGDVNWGGILNIAMDVRGQNIFIDMLESPGEVEDFFTAIAAVIERFTIGVASQTSSTSISVNRNVRNISKPIYLHSECSHTMISNDDYRNTLYRFDKEWSKKYTPYGIHYCGDDPHRFAQDFATLPNLDFLDVGWGGEISTLRQHLPNTFLNIRYSPIEIIKQTPQEISAKLTELVKQSDNPYLTGICCINMDDQVSDEQVAAIFETANQLREEYARETA